MSGARSSLTTEHRGIDPAFREVRETPAAPSWPIDRGPPPVPDERPEPVLAMASIQGNVVAGFNKDFQALLYFHIEDARRFKSALVELAPLVATAEEVLAFNRLFKQVRDRRGHSDTLKAAWMNIALSFAGLRKLTDDAEFFADPSFRAGLVEQAAAIGDTTDTSKWMVTDGESDNAADVLIIVAADTEADVQIEEERVTRLICERGGAYQVGRDDGRARSDLRGHEHFGYLDGVSQPGIRGRASESPTDLLTPRQNPHDRSQGKPGQELIWPGEFVFGYPGQRGSRDGDERGGDSSIDGAGYPRVPKWALDGSYLVFRRFRQDVHAFHEFLRAESRAAGPDAAARVGARLIGRWASGAPIMRAPETDNRDLGDNDCANNYFWFTRETGLMAGRLNGDCPRDVFPSANGDPEGKLCPFTAHIRKVNPRDGVAPEVRRLHRILRRGLPFGQPSASTTESPHDDGAERGLLFLAYMTSIVDQFEFVMTDWVGEDFPGKANGPDALLGPDRNWITPTGGGYYFAPSVFALRFVLSR